MSLSQGSSIRSQCLETYRHQLTVSSRKQPWRELSLSYNKISSLQNLMDVSLSSNKENTISPSILNGQIPIEISLSIGSVGRMWQFHSHLMHLLMVGPCGSLCILSSQHWAVLGCSSRSTQCTTTTLYCRSVTLLVMITGNCNAIWSENTSCGGAWVWLILLYLLSLVVKTCSCSFYTCLTISSNLSP